LRELGEGDVGGAEMLKSRAPEEAFGEGSVSKERARNIAKLYGWWIARGSVSLSILKVSILFPDP
jgi:nucleolar MIF4G domain-containing protein 1